MKELYWDNHLLILEKPAGIATQPDFHQLAKAYVKEKANKPGNVFLEPIHRLDKPVSGMVLFARTSKALSRLNEAMRQKKIEKYYLASVEGEIAREGTLRHNLLHGDHKALVNPQGKEAILHYRRLETRENFSLIEIHLVTGRYHQIRCQFAEEGYPIVGDKKYGSRQKGCLALHHHRLSFPHPTTGKYLTIECPAPALFE